MTKRPLVDLVRRRLRARVVEPFDHRVVAPLRRTLNRRRSYRPLFVAGASGGGTSFLAMSVGQAFDCAGVVYESNLQVDPRSFLHVPDLEAYGSTADYLAAIEPRPSWSVDEARADLEAMYRSYCWGPGELVVDKGPDTNLVRAGFLARCFPEALFLLIYRDPVANVEGLRRKWRTFGNESVEETVRFYAEIHERFLGEAKDFAERVAAIDYDRWVEAYDEKLAAIGRRLGLEPARRRRRLPSRANVEGMGIRNVSKSRISVVRDANRSARARLGEEEAELISSALAPLHAKLQAAPYNV